MANQRLEPIASLRFTRNVRMNTMKKLIFCVIGALALTIAAVPAEYREFTNQDGKSIHACIVQFDAEGERVRLELKSHKKAWIGLSDLCEKDQAYIREFYRHADTGGSGSSRRSIKRGVCINHLTEAEAQELSRGVSWFYNWHWKCDYNYPSVDMEFYPMVWGVRPDDLVNLENELRRGRTASHLLVLNEPNLKEQAFATPKTAAEFYLAVKRVADKHGIRIIGPHMALGSTEDQSITTYDPIEAKEITYTYMIPYLNAFFHFVGGMKDIEAIAVHSYGNINELEWMINMLQEAYPEKPIWITEFAWWGAKNEQEMSRFMKDAVALFEKNQAVEKYAWFKAHMGTGNPMSLFNDDGELTRLGKDYISLPFYDPETKKIIRPDG